MITFQKFVRVDVCIYLGKYGGGSPECPIFLFPSLHLKKTWKVRTSISGPVLKHLRGYVNPLLDSVQYVFPTLCKIRMKCPVLSFLHPSSPFSHLCIFLHSWCQNISHQSSRFYNQQIIRKVESFLSLLIFHFQQLNENKYIDFLLKCLNLCGYVIPE